MKLTNMTSEQLDAYVQRWTRTRNKYQQGSKNWRKCNDRIKNARKQY